MIHKGITTEHDDVNVVPAKGLYLLSGGWDHIGVVLLWHLHPFGQFYSQYAHCFPQNGSYCANEHKPPCKQILIRLLKDRGIVIILIKFLCQFVSEICYHCRRKCLPCLCNLRRIGIQYLDEPCLLWRKGKILFEVRYLPGLSAFICLAQNGFNPSMSVLYERACVSLEVNGLLRVEKHRFLRIHFDNEILKSTQSNDVEEFLFFFIAHIGKFATCK